MQTFSSVPPLSKARPCLRHTPRSDRTFSSPGRTLDRGGEGYIQYCIISPSTLVQRACPLGCQQHFTSGEQQSFFLTGVHFLKNIIFLFTNPSPWSVIFFFLPFSRLVCGGPFLKDRILCFDKFEPPLIPLSLTPPVDDAFALSMTRGGVLFFCVSRNCVPRIVFFKKIKKLLNFFEKVL